jgi:hypothetical protein
LDCHWYNHCTVYDTATQSLNFHWHKSVIGHNHWLVSDIIIDLLLILLLTCQRHNYWLVIDTIIGLPLIPLLVCHYMLPFLGWCFPFLLSHTTIESGKQWIENKLRRQTLNRPRGHRGWHYLISNISQKTFNFITKLNYIFSKTQQCFWSFSKICSKMKKHEFEL